MPAFTGNTPITWNDKELQKLIEPIEYLKGYGLQEGHKLILEPSVPCEIRGYVLFATQHKGFLLLHVQFVDSEEIQWDEWKIISTESPNS